ncbi:Antitoxin HigA [Vibrio aerogenes CECT 7868]|uniref:Antitoxin HigA n=1 Tax=Vibrio aerogenes CECT 7868 TaxID=1216006 RepID=A0A1M5ZS36_9VIBR|nr:helix-turn-helix domain-containing protein [Vibrio aerogenes]SHI27034.1 Antitoxin HigA [Vibrio aerogenes CECT 7868]
MKSQTLDALDALMTDDELAQAKAKAESMLFELNLAEFRRIVQKSQTEVADIMGVKQPTVANLEKNGKDVKLLSLKRYIEALGGKLRLDVELPDGTHRGLDI